MPFWKKSFLILLILFESCIILAISVIITYIHKEEMDKTQNNAVNQAYFIASAISKDLYNIKNYGELTDSLIEDVFDTYESYYEANGVKLEMWNNGISVYGSTPQFDNKLESLKNLGESKTVIKKIGGHREIFVSTAMLSPYTNYTIIYSTSLSQFDNTWTNIINGAVIFGGVVTVFLAGILVLALHNLTRPLRELQKATQEIAQGSYSSRVNIKGKDEFAQLASYYNSMAENIESKIQELSDTNV